MEVRGFRYENKIPLLSNEFYNPMSLQFTAAYIRGYGEGYKGIGRGGEGVCGDFLADQLSYTLQTVRYNTDGQQSLDVLFSYTVFSCCFAVEAAFCETQIQALCYHPQQASRCSLAVFVLLSFKK